MSNLMMKEMVANFKTCVSNSLTRNEDYEWNVFKANNYKTPDSDFISKCFQFNEFLNGIDRTNSIGNNYFLDHSFVASYDKVPTTSHKKFEIAIIGRSNVGKSSLVSSIFKGKATDVKISKTPGRTQTLNYFLLKRLNLYLVDMPGYGFAKVPKSLLRGWHVLIRDYFKHRMNYDKYLITLWLLDVRRIKDFADAIAKNPENATNPTLGLKKSDVEFFHYLVKNEIPYTIVLTKVDKQNYNVLGEVIKSLRILLLRELKELKMTKTVNISPNIILSSAKRGHGIPEIRNFIASTVTSSLDLLEENSKFSEISVNEFEEGDDTERGAIFGGEEDEYEEEEIEIPQVIATPEKKSKDKPTKEEVSNDDDEFETESKQATPKSTAPKKHIKISTIQMGTLTKQNKYVQRTKHLDDKVNRSDKQYKSYEDIVKYKIREERRKSATKK
ncbi:predicted protein [Naegleria gruberi]|uniref:Predicted protein n=1 Tax=Naegleria gruberi TaxID=5762 RepID=D2VD73_NAEGR|nr:uncharacterized protein NAEGRDRAFT_66930 [Naegleria gruberi]EFC45281.1 predicted protein [Naegleria gruberi]|eukprot:XP_002678025.1 predicted protein [Naegleria gruberi strain NEG-M]